jgi:hypothetical protein
MRWPVALRIEIAAVVAEKKRVGAAELVEGRARYLVSNTSSPSATTVLVWSLLPPVIASLHLAPVLLAMPLPLPALGRPVLHPAHWMCRLRFIGPHHRGQPSWDGEGR